MFNWHILNMDSDSHLRNQIGDYLGKHGFRVSTAHTRRDLWRTLEQVRVDLLLLGPDVHGETDLELLRQLRSATDLPMIVSNTGQDDSDRILALEFGADDHLHRPFNPRELLARIRSFQRRSSSLQQAAQRECATFSFSGWQFSPQRNELRCPQGNSRFLTAGERRLLYVFVRSSGRILSRERLQRLIDDVDASGTRNIDTMVWRLRKKLEPSLIRTERNEGYAFTVRVEVVNETATQTRTPSSTH